MLLEASGGMPTPVVSGRFVQMKLNEENNTNFLWFTSRNSLFHFILNSIQSRHVCAPSNVSQDNITPPPPSTVWPAPA